MTRARRIALAAFLGVFAAAFTVGVALACAERQGAACGPILFQGSPSTLQVGIQIGSTCTEPGITDYVVTITGPNGFQQVVAVGSVNPPSPIVPRTVLDVPTKGDYTLTLQTTTRRGETQDCVIGSTEQTVQVAMGASASPSPSPSPSPSVSPSPGQSPSPGPSPTKTPKPTPKPSAEPSPEPTPSASEQPSETPISDVSLAPGTTGEPAASASPSGGGVAVVGTPGPSGQGGPGGAGGGGGGLDIVTMVLVAVIVIGGLGAAGAAILYLRQSRLAAEAPWRAGPWKCARCNAINREGTERCRRCYGRWDGTP